MLCCLAPVALPGIDLLYGPYHVQAKHVKAALDILYVTTRYTFTDNALHVLEGRAFFSTGGSILDLCEVQF